MTEWRNRFRPVLLNHVPPNVGSNPDGSGDVTVIKWESDNRSWVAFTNPDQHSKIKAIVVSRDKRDPRVYCVFDSSLSPVDETAYLKKYDIPRSAFGNTIGDETSKRLTELFDVEGHHVHLLFNNLTASLTPNKTLQGRPAEYVSTIFTKIQDGEFISANPLIRSALLNAMQQELGSTASVANRKK